MNIENMPKPPKEIRDWGVLDHRTDEEIQDTIDKKGSLEGFLTWSYCYAIDLNSDVPSIREEALEEIAYMVVGHRFEDAVPRKIEAVYLPDVFCAWGDDVCVFYRISF